MDKRVVLGEILYTGLNIEKARCNPVGLWKPGYRKSLLAHLSLLRQIAGSITEGTVTDQDKIVIDSFHGFLSRSKIYREKAYPARFQSLSFSDLADGEKGDDSAIVERLMLQLLDDVISALGNRKSDKQDIYLWLRALHNLPRYFLGVPSLLGLDGKKISADLAVQYSFDNMDAAMRNKYASFITQ